MEQYRDIQGYEGLYQVTSWGRVYSVKSKGFIKPYITHKGYARVDLYDTNGKRTHHKVHRLVANAFLNNVHGKPQVNHKDGNKLNNSFTNLEFCTNLENARHRSMMYGGVL